ncbi:phage tail tip domain-containing protein, partial [Escherichia coli]|uniref:phage tail tip domain-containing protein n=1 Tax=Escherichia coli TaxID=562 RepID=UPI003FCEC296
FIVGGPVGDFELLLCHGTVCVVGKMRDLILQLSKSSIYSTKPAVIDMPSGGGSVTLEFKIFQKGNQGAGNITDCTVIVTKKAASGISIR